MRLKLEKFKNAKMFYENSNLAEFLHCCGLLVSSPGPCASSGGRLPEALFMVFLLDSKGAKVCKACRFRQELSNEYLLTKFGVDTAENGPLKVCQKLANS